MSVKLFDSELRVMEVLWKEGDMTAGQLAKILREQIGWNRNTTYTVIKKLIEKEAITRREPNFMCSARISRQEVQQQETTALIDRLFDGSAEFFLSAYLRGRALSEGEIAQLKEFVETLK